jgi:nucleoside-diphosphate-sugar epimerase
MIPKKNILVTGSGGFIGKHILEALGDTFNIYTLSRTPNKTPNCIVCDITEIDKIEISLDYIIHAAGNKKEPSEMYRVNVQGTEAVVKLAQKTKAKLIHIGSGGVYGIYSNPDKIITTTSAYHPQNEYEKTKAAADEVIITWGKKNPDKYVILQPTNVFGEGDQTKKLLNLCKSLKKNQFFFLNKKAFVNYVYVQSICDVILEVLKKNQFDNKKYIINDPLQIDEFIKIISKEIGVKTPERHIPKLFQPILYAIAAISSKLPVAFQKFTLGKYHELTSTKYYQPNFRGAATNEGKSPNIQIGIHNLVAHYRNNNWL